MRFHSGNRQFGASSRKPRDCAVAYTMYAAQEIPQIDTEIAQKGHFRTVTILRQRSGNVNKCKDILQHKSADAGVAD